MLNKIFGFFKKSKRTKITSTMTTYQYANAMLNADKILNITSEVDKVNFDNEETLSDDLKTCANNLGIKLKYRDKTTGELHEVEWTDENFDKIMMDKNACLVFG